MGHPPENHRVHGAQAGRLTAPHLWPAVVALLLVAVALAAGYRRARGVERGSIHGLATGLIPDVAQRRALQLEACRRRDLLLVYGSSELLIDDPYHATALFRDYPTGFAVVPVGQKAGCSVLHVQHLSALGSALRGKKVVLSFTANTFFQQKLGQEAYAGNFSRLDADELAFSTDLSVAVKHAAARRMLEYPGTLRQDPLLAFALRQLADGSPTGTALYYAAFPLGRLQIGLMRMQDHWDVVGFVKDQHPPPDPRPRRAGPPPGVAWPALAARGERMHHRRANNNPFGFDDDVWLKRFQDRAGVGFDAAKDAHMRRALDAGQEWEDLGLLLRALRELGAEPLLVATPLKGCYFEHTCISAATRRAYYERFRDLAQANGVPLVTFDDHDEDRDFLYDASHLSSKGWVYYDYTLDAFFHGCRGPDLVLRPATGSPGRYPADDLMSQR
jgi:D-alanine transfer protein